jgi:sulfite exporter TauE/SafE
MDADLLLLGGAALSGLLGTGHCAAMCGGIATSFGVRNDGNGWLQALQPNLGRVLGYGVAGAIAGGIGHGIVTIAELPWLAQAMRAAAGAVLVLAALRMLDTRGRLRYLAMPATLAARALGPMRRFTHARRGALQRLLAGVLWGWLPCGLSSTVLFAAWLQSSAMQGAATMLAFGAGTLPAMVTLSWSGARLGRALNQRGWRVAAATCVLVAGLLTLLAPWLASMHGVHRLLAAAGCRSVS